MVSDKVPKLSFKFLFFIVQKQSYTTVIPFEHILIG